MSPELQTLVHSFLDALCDCCEAVEDAGDDDAQPEDIAEARRATCACLKHYRRAMSGLDLESRTWVEQRLALRIRHLQAQTARLMPCDLRCAPTCTPLHQDN